MKKETLKYIIKTIEHKWYVFLGGLRTKAPIWRLIVHDYSKFTPSEAPHYGRQFFGDKGDPDGFATCWTRHQNRNAHHAEYWVQRGGKNNGIPVPMPDWAVREMVADWLGAGRAYNGKWPDVKNWTWLNQHYEKLPLHPDSRELLKRVLYELGAIIQIKCDQCNGHGQDEFKADDVKDYRYLPCSSCGGSGTITRGFHDPYRDYVLDHGGKAS